MKHRLRTAALICGLVSSVAVLVVLYLALSVVIETREKVARDQVDLHRGEILFPIGHCVFEGEPGSIYRDRLDTTIALWRKRPRTIWLLAGGQSETRESAARVGKRYLVGRGIPPSDVKALDDFPEYKTSLDTTEEIWIASHLAKASGVATMIVVADTIHLAQARLVFASYGLSVLLAGTPQRSYGLRYRLTRTGALVVTTIDRRGHSLFWLRWIRSRWPNWPWSPMSDMRSFGFTC